MLPIVAGVILILFALVFAFLFTRARLNKSLLIRLPVAILAGILAVLLGPIRRVH
jgi:hypothetical protein